LKKVGAFVEGKKVFDRKKEFSSNVSRDFENTKKKRLCPEKCLPERGRCLAEMTP